MLQQRLPGVRTVPHSEPISVVAYAYFTNFLTSADDISTVQTAIQEFEMSSGARFNPHKSRALPSGGGMPPTNPWHPMPTPCADTGNSLLGHFTSDRLRLVGTTCWFGKNKSKRLLSA